MSQRSGKRAIERSASLHDQDNSDDDKFFTTSSSVEAHRKCTTCGGNGCNKGDSCGGCRKKKDSHACCAPIVALPQIKHLGPNTTISGSLTVVGPPLQLNGIIDAANAVFNNLVIGDVDFNDATFTGNTLVEDNLQVDGPSTFNQTSTFNQASNFNDSANFEGPSTFNGPTVYNGDLTINGSVDFGLDITFNGTITYDGPTIFNDQSIFNELVTFNNEVDFSSPVTFDFPVTVNNTIEFNGTIEFNTPLEIDVNVTISGTTTFTGEVDFQFPLTINVDVTFNGTVTFNNVVTYTDTVTFEEEVFMEGPLDIEIQDPLPPGTPALKICQNTPEPTTLDLCNQNPAGGSQIVFSGPPGNEPAIQSIPPSAVIPAGVSVMVPVVGAAPIAAIAAPALLAPGVAGGVPVAAAAAAAAGAGGGAAGVAAAAGALAGAASGAGAIVGVAGILAAPVIAVTSVTGGLPATLPKGSISLDPLTLDLKNGEESIVTWKPNITVPDVQGVNTTSDGDIPTTSDGDIPTSPQQDLGPNDPKTIGTADPTKPATIGVPTLIVDSESSPTSFILAGPCDEEARFVWDCTTGTLQLVLFDNAGPTTTIIQEWTDSTTTIYNTFVTSGAVSFVDVTLTGTTTIQDVLNVTAVSNFTGDVTLNNQTWVNGSTISISAGGTITALGAGTLDLSAWTVIIPSPGFNNVTLTGITTIQDGLDLVPLPANPRPGGNPTLWADSLNSNAFRYEANPVAVCGTAATVVNEIPVFTSTFGTISSAAGGTATLNHPLLVAGTGFTPFTSQSTSATQVSNVFANLSGTSNAVAIRFGELASSTRWDVGIDLSSNLSNTFFIRDVNTGGTPAILISGTQMVQLRDGIQLQFSKYLPQAAIPANADATSIWVSSVDSTRPRWGTTEQLALLTDIIAPTYNNVTLTGTTTVDDTLQVNADATFVNGIVVNSLEFPFFVSNPAASLTNLWKDSNGVLRQGNQAIPSMGLPVTANVIPVVVNTNAIMSTAASATPATINRPLTYVDLATSVSNPGGPRTLWANSADDALFYGEDPVINLTNLLAIMGIEEWTGTWVLSNVYFASSQNISVKISKIRNQVVVAITSEVVVSTLGDESDPFEPVLFTPDALMPATLRPDSNDLNAYIGTWDVSFPSGGDSRFGIYMRWDSANNRFNLGNVNPGVTFDCNTGYFNYLTA